MAAAEQEDCKNADLTGLQPESKLNVCECTTGHFGVIS